VGSVRFVQDGEGDHRADLFKESASSSAKAVDQQIVFRVSGYCRCCTRSGRFPLLSRAGNVGALLSSVDEHVKAGLAVSPTDVDRGDVAARKEELIAAQGDLELAWAALREAMGAPDLKATELKPIEPHTFPRAR